jgi:catechol 2,3-dioxygenase-like lactoylglutathione lyase family enzyme
LGRAGESAERASRTPLPEAATRRVRPKEIDLGIAAGTIRSISELALWVSDLDRAIAFYVDKLGFAVESRDPGRNAFLKSGDFLLVLFVPEDPGTPLAREYLARVGAPRGGVYHVAFRTDPAALDPMAEALRAGDVSVSGPVEFPGGRRSYFLEDLDQHYIELTDR